MGYLSLKKPIAPKRWRNLHSELKTPSMMPTGTVRLHRILRANPERVYRAFLDADAMAKRLPPYGYTCQGDRADNSRYLIKLKDSSKRDWEAMECFLIQDHISNM